jgi:hypothetical protein
MEEYRCYQSFIILNIYERKEKVGKINFHIAYIGTFIN